MMDDDTPQGLNAVLYFLNYITDVSANPVLPDHLVEQIKHKYKSEMSKLMCVAVKWAIANPNFNYESQIPVHYNNKQIYEYLINLDKIFAEENVYSKFL